MATQQTGKQKNLKAITLLTAKPKETSGRFDADDVWGDAADDVSIFNYLITIVL